MSIYPAYPSSYSCVFIPISFLISAVLGLGYNIISAVENCEKQTSAIQKIRQLQENELQAILDTGTYVQCCDCSKWRSVPLVRAPGSP